MRILIVEDSVTMRRVMEMTFAGEDADLLAVENGELALQQGRDFGPDVAFVDASLPGIDGYEVTRAMKADPQLAGTAVVLMASQHRPLDEARASAAEVLNRTRLEAEGMLDELRLEALQARVLGSVREAAGRYDLVINATSLGLRASDPLPSDLSRLEATVAFDCVYGREGTAWTRHARGAGLTADDGLEMLVEQARLSVLNWLGVEPPAGPMHEAARAALAG